MEIWKPIPGYENLYEVSNLGRIKSLRREVPMFFGGVRVDPETLLTPITNKHRYFFIKLSRNGCSRTLKVHRLVLLAFVGPSTLAVNHIDFDRQNNKLENLEYVTHQENFDHSRANHKAAVPIGERNKKSKLTNDQRDLILSLKGQVSAPKLARQFGVHHSTIQGVWERWGRLTAAAYQK